MHLFSGKVLTEDEQNTLLMFYQQRLEQTRQQLSMLQASEQQVHLARHANPGFPRNLPHE